MNRYLSAFVALAVLVGGTPSWLPAQETPDSNTEATSVAPPRLTPDERRQRWEEMRGNTEEERRQRMAQWRQNREEREAQATLQEPAPENYIDQLEFRSILSLAGVTQFSLRNPYENRTLVVSAQEGRNGVEVVGFDADSNSLTIRHGEETRTLSLQTSRVVEMAAPQQNDAGSRREMWDARRERFQEFRATWERAAETSPELREIQTQFRELGSDFRRNREVLQAAKEGSPQHQQAQARELEMREEFRLLTEYSMLEVQQNPAFAPEDIESIQGMMRGMMWRSDEGHRGQSRPGYSPTR
jgi:hypothetical protein